MDRSIIDALDHTGATGLRARMTAAAREWTRCVSVSVAITDAVAAGSHEAALRHSFVSLLSDNAVPTGPV